MTHKPHFAVVLRFESKAADWPLRVVLRQQGHKIQRRGNIVCTGMWGEV